MTDNEFNEKVESYRKDSVALGWSNEKFEKAVSVAGDWTNTTPATQPEDSDLPNQTEEFFYHLCDFIDGEAAESDWNY